MDRDLLCSIIIPPMTKYSIRIIIREERIKKQVNGATRQLDGEFQDVVMIVRVMYNTDIGG